MNEKNKQIIKRKRTPNPFQEYEEMLNFINGMIHGGQKASTPTVPHIDAEVERLRA